MSLTAHADLLGSDYNWEADLTDAGTWTIPVDELFPQGDPREAFFAAWGEGQLRVRAVAQQQAPTHYELVRADGR